MKKQIKKTLLPILLLSFLVACKTTKNKQCECYGQMYVDQDTITITTEHINYGNICSTDTTIVTFITDTICFKTMQK